MNKYLPLLAILFSPAIFAANFMVYPKENYDHRPIAQITHSNQSEYMQFYKGQNGWIKVANRNTGLTGWINTSIPKISSISTKPTLSILEKVDLKDTQLQFVSDYHEFMNHYNLVELSPYANQYSNDTKPYGVTETILINLH